jgi:hypothetical protein
LTAGFFGRAVFAGRAVAFALAAALGFAFATTLDVFALAFGLVFRLEVFFAVGMSPDSTPIRRAARLHSKKRASKCRHDLSLLSGRASEDGRTMADAEDGKSMSLSAPLVSRPTLRSMAWSAHRCANFRRPCRAARPRNCV